MGDILGRMLTAVTDLVPQDVFPKVLVQFAKEAAKLFPNDTQTLKAMADDRDRAAWLAASLLTGNPKGQTGQAAGLMVVGGAPHRSSGPACYRFVC